MREIVADVTYTFQKGDPGCMYQRNGDPGWPPEPPEIEIVEVRVQKDQVPAWFALAVEQSGSVWNWLADHHQEPEREYERTIGK